MNKPLGHELQPDYQPVHIIAKCQQLRGAELDGTLKIMEC